MPTLFPPEEVLRSGCDRCREEVAFAFTFAFQPIVDVAQREVFGYEALVRGPQGEPAMTVLGRVDDTNRYAFDQACRVHAITLASRLGLDRHLSINFLPMRSMSRPCAFAVPWRQRRNVAFRPRRSSSR